MRKRKKMSQREAVQWKRRAIYAERLANIRTFTPGCKRTIATFTCTEAQEREWRMAEFFGATMRVEKTGRRFDVCVFKDDRRPDA